MKLKRCSYCKRHKNINCFSPGQWKIEKPPFICCSCVRERKPKARDPKAGQKVWARR